MLDRQVVKDFLDFQFENMGIEIPHDINKWELVESFCQYVEDDLYEWLKSNFNAYFLSEPSNIPNWDLIRENLH